MKAFLVSTSAGLVQVRDQTFRLRLFSQVILTFEQKTLMRHIVFARENSTICCGVKRECVFTKSLSFFHVTQGYPPDIVHDLCEGVILVEIALCIGEFISKKSDS